MLHIEKDATMKEFLNNEIADNEAKIEQYEQRLKVLLLPRDPMDDKDIMLEIRGSAGGDEANIFAGDLLNQCIGSSFGLRSFGIPFIGLYGACSTMALRARPKKLMPYKRTKQPRASAPVKPSKMKQIATKMRVD